MARSHSTSGKIVAFHNQAELKPYSPGVASRVRTVKRRPYFDCNRAFFAFAISVSLALSTSGYARSRDTSVSITAAATTTRVNHFLSAGTTYHGLCLVAVFRIM